MKTGHLDRFLTCCSLSLSITLLGVFFFFVFRPSWVQTLFFSLFLLSSFLRSAKPSWCPKTFACPRYLASQHACPFLNSSSVYSLIRVRIEFPMHISSSTSSSAYWDAFQAEDAEKQA